MALAEQKNDAFDWATHPATGQRHEMPGAMNRAIDERTVTSVGIGIDAFLTVPSSGYVLVCETATRNDSGTGDASFSNQQIVCRPIFLTAPVQTIWGATNATATGQDSNPPPRDESGRVVTERTLPFDEISRLLLDLARGTAEQPLMVHSALVRHASPDALWEVARAKHRVRGGEVWALIASDILGDMGPRAWSTLQRIASVPGHEAEPFVRAVFQCPGVSRADRLSVLLGLARNHEIGVRWRVLEDISLLLEADRVAVLRTLAGGWQDEVADEAQAQLAAR